MEVARAGQVRFQRRDVSTEFQSKKVTNSEAERGNSRASPDVFLSSASNRAAPRTAFYTIYFAPLTLIIYAQTQGRNYDVVIMHVVIKLLRVHIR